MKSLITFAAIARTLASSRPHVGHDPEAPEAACKAVADFLRATFRLAS